MRRGVRPVGIAVIFESQLSGSALESETSLDRTSLRRDLTANRLAEAVVD